MIGGWLKGAAGGVVEPVVDGARDVLVSREDTKQAQSKAWAAAKIAAATWRPWLARATGAMMLAYVAGSFIFALMLFAGIALGATWADIATGDSSMNHLVEYWRWLGIRIFTFAGLFLTTYAGVRGGEKIADKFRKPKPAERKPAEVPEKIETTPTLVKYAQGIKKQQPSKRHAKSYKASARTMSNLATVDDALAAVALRAFDISEYDYVVIEGQRSVSAHKTHVESGASRTMESRHIEDPAQAFDIMAIDETGKATWGNGTPNDPYYSEIARAMKLAAADLGIGITCGIDWGWDGGHFERSRKEVPFEWPAGVDLELGAPS